MERKTIIDMHLHLKGRSNCSKLIAYVLLKEISAEITGVCITDHDIIQPDKNMEKTNLQVFWGAEITTKLGDILIYGVEAIPPLYFDLHQTFAHVHKQGGIVICAHPFAQNRYAFGDSLYDYKFDAIEINGSVEKKANKQAEQSAKIMDLPLVGGSDAHHFDHLNTVATFFEKKIETIKDLVESVKNHECQPIRIRHN